MGSRMAPHLMTKGGHNLFVFDINDKAVAQLESKGAVACSSPAEVAKNSDVIITMLPASPHVKDVYMGQGALLKNSRSGAIFIDSSTIDPDTVRLISKTARDEYGVLMVDAPVSGGVGGAEAGTLTFMVGAEEKDFPTVKELLNPMAKNVVHCGGVGTGQVAKICNNLVLGISMIGVSEAMNLGVKLGADPKKLAGIFNTSTARCWSSDTYNPYPGVMENVPASRGYTGGFGARLMHKDLGLAIEAAKTAGVPLPLGSDAERLYKQMGDDKEWGDKDFSGVIQFLQKLGNKQ
eukprot:GEZU01013880.1.p2 GENE.GEZU01013880.1~~GEZU01013880.1.p2  ORF type:complete len:292 (-),score=118.47 GEZU01013880.1:33-908(-)